MRAKLNHLHIAYSDEGKGPPIMFVHGFPLSRGAWSKQIGALKKQYHVIAPDLRGFGESEGTVGPISMSTYASDVHALAQYLRLDPFVLVGHSMGGYVAMAFVKAFPELVRGLVLVGTKAPADNAEASTARALLAERVREEGSSVVLDSMASKMLSRGNKDLALQRMVSQLIALDNPEGVVGALLGMAARPDARAWLGQVKAPTCIVQGAEDDIVPRSEAVDLASLIPGAQLHVITRAGHLVAFEQAGRFNEILGTWMAEQDVDPPTPSARNAEMWS